MENKAYPKEEALNEFAIRVFATREAMKRVFESACKKFGAEKAVSMFNEEAKEYGIEMISENIEISC